MVQMAEKIYNGKYVSFQSIFLNSKQLTIKNFLVIF
jgi:hypothetical protein